MIILLFEKDHSGCYLQDVDGASRSRQELIDSGSDQGCSSNRLEKNSDSAYILRVGPSVFS